MGERPLVHLRQTIDEADAKSEAKPGERGQIRARKTLEKGALAPFGREAGFPVTVRRHPSAAVQAPGWSWQSRRLIPKVADLFPR